MLKVSFVVPTFNSVTWLPHAVKTVLAQSYKNVELVVVDDASTDRTAQYLNWLAAQKDERVKIVRLPENVGRSKARNLGNQASTGDIICVLDADDIAAPNRAELTARKFQSGKLDFVYGSASIIDAVGNKIGEIRADVFNKDRALSEKMNRIVHSTVAYTREIAEKYPYAEGELSDLGLDDWHQQIRVSLDGKRMDYIPQTISAYRISQFAISKTRDEAAVLALKEKTLAGLAVTA